MADSYDEGRKRDIAHLCALRQITPLEFCLKLEDELIELRAENARLVLAQQAGRC